MAVNLTFSSRGARQAAKDMDALQKSAKKLPEGYIATAKEARELERAHKKMITAITTPQEKFNQKMKQLSKILAAHPGEYKKVERAAALYRKELKEAERGGKAAFGMEQIRNLAAIALGYVSIRTAINAVTGALRDFHQEQQTEVTKAIGSRQALGGLAQLAAGDPAKLRGLLTATKTTFAEGAFETQSEAARLTFELESAGALRERRFFSRLQTIDDAAQIAKSAGLIRQAFGAEEAGTFRDISGKGIAAAAPATGVTPSSILAGAARAGKFGQQLGLSDEEVLAATSMVAQITGSGEEAGTATRALFKSLTKQGFGGRGRGLSEILGGIEAKGETPQQLLKRFGRAEALQAFQIVQGGDFAGRLAAIGAAERGDLAGQAIRTALGAAEVREPRETIAARNLRALQLEQRQLAQQDFEQDLARQVIEARAGGGQLRGIGAALGETAVNLINEIAGPENLGYSGSEPAAPFDVIDYLRRTAESTEKAVNQNAPAGRAE
jgi:hypothetical protein